MRWSRACAVLVATAAVVGWLGCPRSGPRSVREGMAAARPLPLAPVVGLGEARPLAGHVDGALDAARGREQWWSIALPEGGGRLDVSLSHEGADDSVTFQVLDAEGELRATAPLLPRSPTDLARADTVEVVLLDVPGPLYVRAYAVADGAPRAYTLSARFTPTRVAVDAGPPCDPKAIDPENPACEGVQPWCDPNEPDFTNPNCCLTLHCEYSACGAAIENIRREGNGLVGTMTLGSTTGVVRGVTGDLNVVRVGENTTTARGGHIGVLAVDADRATVSVHLPDGVTVEDVGRAWSRILPPVECVIRDRAAD